MRRLLPLLVLLLLALPAAAQETTDGSVYSRFGIGELQPISSPQVQGLGGGGTALASPNYLNLSNPAVWGDQVLTRAVLGLRYQGVAIEDGAGDTSTLTDGSLGPVQFGFPLLSEKLGVGLGYAPYSRVGYRVREPEELLVTPLGDSTAYAVSFEGSGGLQRLTGGLGYRLSDALSVGASLDFLFGILETSRRTQFLTSAFQEVNLATSTRLSGFSGTLGALLTLQGLAGDADVLHAGATFTLPASLSGDRIRTLGESLDRDTLGTALEGDMNLPYQAALGLAYRPDDRWTLVLDGAYAPWSTFDSDLSVPGFEPDGENLFQDRVRVSGGAEFLPAGADFLAPYFRRVGYRLGAYYEDAYVLPVAGEEVQTVAVTGGLSLPTLLSGTRLDLNVEVGTRGSTDGPLVRDRFYRLSANVNFGERWFVKRKLR